MRSAAACGSLLALVAALVAALAGLAVAATVSEEHRVDALLARGVPPEHIARAVVAREEMLGRATPSGDYAPANVTCPAPNTTAASYVGMIRNASGFALYPGEADYIRNHRQAHQADWAAWLNQSQVGLDASLPGGVANYTSNLDWLPRIGITSSGGGFRAMLTGAGAYAAFDARNTTAAAIGTGGLLQLADYIVGLSGGSWLVSSVAINDYPTTQSLHDQVWDLESNLIAPSDHKTKFYANLISVVGEKKKVVGSDYTGITDYWSRALGMHLINNTRYPNYGINVTWSDVRNVSSFQNFTAPFPIIISDERDPGQTTPSPDSAIWEFTPYEFGTWQHKTNAFIDVDLVGSAFNNGQPLSNTSCLSGWDTAYWVPGVSSTLFNEALIEVSNSSGGIFKKVIQEILKGISDDQNDVTVIPNSFQGYNTDESQIANATTINLTDGGEDGQNIPLFPLINPGRGLDFVIAVDATNDNDSWPTGSSMVATATRFNATNGTDFAQYPFPVVPTTEGFINQGLNTRPTFFGCPGSQIINANTSWNGSLPPIIAYLPNYPYSGWGNTSTMQLSYKPDESQTVIDNMFNAATMGNATAGTDIAWPTCLACAMLTRSFQRSNTPIPDTCATCLSAYCWNGDTNISTPAPYSPAIGAPAFATSAGKVQAEPSST